MGLQGWGGKGPADADLVAEVKLEGWVKVEDISPKKNRGILMTKVVESAEGADYKMPKDMGTATARLLLSLPDGTVVKDYPADAPLVRPRRTQIVAAYKTRAHKRVHRISLDFTCNF